MPLRIESHKCADCSFRSLIFDKVSNHELEHLNNCKREYIFHKGEKIILEGEQSKEFVYLKRGLIKLSRKTENKKEQIISISKPKNFIGFLDVFSHDSYQYTITALSKSEMCFIDTDIIKNLIQDNGHFAFEVLTKVCHISDEIIFNRVNICSKQLRGRIAFLLLYLSKEIFNNNEFELPITRREIGELIAMSTENVIRIFSEFKREGILSMTGRRVTLHDYQHLEMISKVG